MVLCLPKSLSKLLEDPKTITFGADEYSGAGEKAGRWEPPEEITAPARRNAAKLMRVLDVGERRRERKLEPGESPRQASGWGWSDPAEMEAQRQYLREKQDRERRELAEIVR